MAAQTKRCTILPARLDRPATHYKVQDERNHSEHKQQVNQSARRMKYGKSAYPRYQQNHKQNCPDTHCLSSKIKSDRLVYWNQTAALSQLSGFRTNS
jgi:hypothetical protein